MSKTNRLVKGELPTKYSCVDWSTDKFLSFLQFVEFFIENGKFAVTIDKIRRAEERAKDETFWDEFLTRMNLPSNGPKTNTKNFTFRLVTFTRNPLTFLKENQYLITPEMHAIMKGNPRFEWALTAVKEVTTKTGVKIVTMDDTETVEPTHTNRHGTVTAPKSPQLLYEQGLMDMAAIFKNLTRTIKPQDMKNISTKDKIALASKLFLALNKGLSGKSPNTVVFKQMNIGTAGARELEQAVLDYAKNNNS
jgi:hypothetical protein